MITPVWQERIVCSMKRVIVFVALVIGGACGQPKGPSSGPPVGAGFDERQACTADADCAVVEIECCDHCNGGTALGVARDTAADIRAEYAGPAECKATACTLMACSAPVAICRQQRCGISIDGNEQMTPLPRP
jgi:hypothetical protein